MDVVFWVAFVVGLSAIHNRVHNVWTKNARRRREDLEREERHRLMKRHFAKLRIASAQRPLPEREARNKQC